MDIYFTDGNTKNGQITHIRRGSKGAVAGGFLVPEGHNPSVGQCWNGRAFVELSPLPKTKEQRLAEIRSERDRLLKESDWTQMPDCPLSGRADIVAYRQKLRDITKRVDPVEWPETPKW